MRDVCRDRNNSIMGLLIQDIHSLGSQINGKAKGGMVIRVIGTKAIKETGIKVMGEIQEVGARVTREIGIKVMGEI